MNNITIEILEAAREFKRNGGGGELTNWEQLLSNKSAETVIEYLDKKDLILHHYFSAIKKIKELEKEVKKLKDTLECDL